MRMSYFCYSHIWQVLPIVVILKAVQLGHRQKQNVSKSDGHQLK